MKTLYHKFLSFFHSIEGNIAFYPAFLSFMGFNFAMLMLFLEKKGISTIIIEQVPELVINNADTAKTLLSFLTGGIISIMVFSFSMVMVLLNQAASNFSPRVLPGLISKRNHQYVLGLYLATILYNTFTLVGINPREDDKYQLPGFSVLLGIILTVLCFFAFLYFIHSISQSIQVNNILDNIYTKAKRRLQGIIDRENEEAPSFPETENWQNYYSQETGYLQTFTSVNLKNICLENDLKIRVLPIPGIFVLKGIPLIKVNKKIDDDMVSNILSNFNFSRGEFVEDNYALAFKQITEIGVKAMSPGINDPGTAINTIDYLTELFAIRMQKNDDTILSSDHQSLIYINTVNFKELLYQVMLSYRNYCKHDMTCVQKLFTMLKYLLLQQTPNKIYHNSLVNEAKLLKEDAMASINNSGDRKRIEELYKSLPDKRD
ncbi:DUF2254 domain-containing protein [Haloflavibacter putidus]|uniref:DUF2254 domain-containing protein n=1 Tax=Haloflavibacter putidus TaxID=2576776 RepID=A0A507ZQY5_9FLAO|nr:DUF2254 domain-containing protein [Haloflavibacter putidus]TQD39377.1 DUF2254 domain-containing protein [Haloflavibacter putidus]